MRVRKLFGKIGPLVGEVARQERMEVNIDRHTLERAEVRGTTEVEIRDVITTGFVVPAHSGRLGKGKVYLFGQERQGIYYEQKRVEVIYIVERGAITTVTVKVFYGTWE